MNGNFNISLPSLPIQVESDILPAFFKQLLLKIVQRFEDNANCVPTSRATSDFEESSLKFFKIARTAEAHLNTFGSGRDRRNP